jgi:uncharacterized membrane protein
MNKMIVAAALAGVFAAGHASTATAAQEPAKEKCYGIAKKGANDCAAADGSHACAGKAATDNSKFEFKAVDKGACEKAGGSLTAPKA